MSEKLNITWCDEGSVTFPVLGTLVSRNHLLYCEKCKKMYLDENGRCVYYERLDFVERDKLLGIYISILPHLLCPLHYLGWIMTDKDYYEENRKKL